MITGFNTDIKHADRVFHVQTEDRGIGNPVVESLVYVGGEILLSKKSPYNAHIKDGTVNEKAVKEMMDLQHRRIIEAIRRGRFDGGNKAAAAAPSAAGGDEPSGEMAAGPDAPPRVSAAAAAATAALLSGKSGPFAAVVKGTAPAPSKKSTPPPSAHRAPSGVGSPPSDRSLDQVIIDYLSSEAASEHLELSLMSGGDLRAGESVPLTVRASTSLTEKPIAGAHVSIRVVSTVGPPQILYRGVTGTDGLVKATCQIPDVGSGNAALIIAASSPLGNNELKQLIKRKA